VVTVIAAGRAPVAIFASAIAALGEMSLLTMVSVSNATVGDCALLSLSGVMTSPETKPDGSL
jgi:hypothetical protein